MNENQDEQYIEISGLKFAGIVAASAFITVALVYGLLFAYLGMQ